MVMQSKIVADWSDGKRIAFIGDGDGISVCVAYGTRTIAYESQPLPRRSRFSRGANGSHRGIGACIAPDVDLEPGWAAQTPRTHTDCPSKGA